MGEHSFWHVVDAYVAFAALHDDAEIKARLRRTGMGRTLAFVSDASLHVRGSKWNYIGALEDASREAYFALVGKRLGSDAADELRSNWARIHDAANRRG